MKKIIYLLLMAIVLGVIGGLLESHTHKVTTAAHKPAKATR